LLNYNSNNFERKLYSYLKSDVTSTFIDNEYVLLGAKDGIAKL